MKSIFHITIFILPSNSGFRQRAGRSRNKLLHNLVIIYGKYVQNNYVHSVEPKNCILSSTLKADDRDAS
jgi:hypothetical protein